MRRFLNPATFAAFYALLTTWEVVAYLENRDKSNLFFAGLYVLLTIWFLFLWRFTGTWRLQPKKPRKLKSPLLSPSQSQSPNERPNLLLHPLYPLASQVAKNLSRSEQIKKVSSPIIGFRIWCLVHSSPPTDVILCPANLHYGQWVPGVNRAVCWRDWPSPNLLHKPAEPGCGCGYWLKDSLKGALLMRTHPFTVVGVAAGWGRVQVHSDGWRCEYAMPLAIAFDPNHNQGLIRPSNVLLDIKALNAELKALNAKPNQVANAVAKIGLRFDIPILTGLDALQEWYIDNTSK